MNTLPYNLPYKFHLISRNEGKIKSYDSCTDLRAWSHDAEARSGYLKAWIKRDMPFRIIPISTLTVFLRTMGYKNLGRLTPRCHPNCKSKVVLESICTSCHNIKQCFQNDPKYEKYFEEEEFETSHWPCERCLEALKSIKMFWRIIMEKVFRINFPKRENLSVSSSNVRYVAKTWQADIAQETVFVNKIKPQFEPHTVKTNSSQCNYEDCVAVSSKIILTQNVTNGSICNSKRNDNLANSEYSKMSEGKKRKRRKVNRSVSVKVKKLDISCEAVSPEDEESKYKNHLNDLEIRFNEQIADIERLKKENLSLKIELHNAYGLTIDPHACTANFPTQDRLAFLPKPYDYQQSDNLGDVESEMIITMKNCRNSGYKQVALLQVLHKSKQPFYSGTTNKNCRDEDPMHVLAKIQTTFGAIVKRETSLASETRSVNPPSNINASYHNVKQCHSKTPSNCSKNVKK